MVGLGTVPRPDTGVDGGGGGMCQGEGGLASEGVYVGVNGT